MSSYCVFLHCKLWKLIFLHLLLLLFWPSFWFPPGCLRDVRFNNRPVPLDKEQASEGLQVVTSQGVSAGCSSEACRKHQCSPPLVCVDLWRHHECRCCKLTQEITQDANEALHSVHICMHRAWDEDCIPQPSLWLNHRLNLQIVLTNDVESHTPALYGFITGARLKMKLLQGRSH